MRIYWRGDDGQPVFASATTVAVHPQFVRDAVQTRRKSIDLGLVRRGAAGEGQQDVGR